MQELKKYFENWQKFENSRNLNSKNSDLLNVPLPISLELVVIPLLSYIQERCSTN